MTVRIILGHTDSQGHDECAVLYEPVTMVAFGPVIRPLGDVDAEEAAQDFLAFVRRVAGREASTLEPKALLELSVKWHTALPRCPEVSCAKAFLLPTAAEGCHGPRRHRTGGETRARPRAAVVHARDPKPAWPTCLCGFQPSGLGVTAADALRVLNQHFADMQEAATA